MVTAAEEFSSLAGRELSAVCFVRDYVELDLDGPVLRFLAPPRVVLHGAALVFPEKGSHDALCALIGRTVRQAEDREDRLTLAFGNEATVEMPKASEEAGPEVAHLVPMAEGSLDVASMVVWENLIPTRDDLSRG
jgi:hypothetical protein